MVFGIHFWKKEKLFANDIRYWFFCIYVNKPGTPAESKVNNHFNTLRHYISHVYSNLKRQLPDIEVLCDEVSPHTKVQNHTSIPNGLPVVSYT